MPTPPTTHRWVRGLSSSRSGHAAAIIYERNPTYWDEGKPYIDRLIVRFIPDAAARSAAIESGEVHLAPSSPVSLGDVERLRAKPNLVFETNGYQYINTIYRTEFNLETPALQDLRVRQAIAHSIQRDNLLKVAWYGQGKLIPGPVSDTLKNTTCPTCRCCRMTSSRPRSCSTTQA